MKKESYVCAREAGRNIAHSLPPFLRTRPPEHVQKMAFAAVTSEGLQSSARIRQSAIAAYRQRIDNGRASKWTFAHAILDVAGRGTSVRGHQQ
jgi:hypothetical protein